MGSLTISRRCLTSFIRDTELSNSYAIGEHFVRTIMVLKQNAS